MNRIERRKYKEEKRKRRRERKRYFREEKESAKRQKKELKENRKEWKRKHGRKLYWKILAFFSFSTEKISRAERLEMIKDKHFAKRQRKNHLKEERRTTHGQHKELRRNIRQARIKNLKVKYYFFIRLALNF